MAEILLFHHAQGQTAGFPAFADGCEQRATWYMPLIYDQEAAALLEGAHSRLPGSRR